MSAAKRPNFGMFAFLGLAGVLNLIGLPNVAYAQSTAGSLYGVRFVGSTWTLFRQDIGSGATTPVANVATAPGGSYESAIDPTSRRFFTFVIDNSNVTRLYAVNVDTGTSTSAIVNLGLGGIQFVPPASLFPTPAPSSFVLVSAGLFLVVAAMYGRRGLSKIRKRDA